MKIAGCVVLYNPDNGLIANISTYLHLVDELFVLDNSTQADKDYTEKLRAIPQVTYISFNGNIGIAGALREGLGRAVEKEYDFCLTMDQDSKFPAISRTELEERLNIPDVKDYGIIGLNFNSASTEKRLVEVRRWLTSGNFIVVENYKKIYGFKSELFIDYVDFDLNEQFYRANKKVAYWEDLSLKHTIGCPKTYRFLFKKFTVMNHSPVRVYYRFRNARYLYKRNKKFYRKVYLHDLFIDIPKIILFEKQKFKKLKMIKKGRRDARKNRLGEFRSDGK